ncbi:type I-C CRISPR-associated protein Cas8c/Csd1 [uncultured Aquimonas sp.]|uniref:type I-C CRISPR-associated protein Cas8c/Csd1 n=1 Tax=uncultured Aquimonas sp. TaxID=385483 RepID=UPI00086CA401|nr:type I-C CRISPR-associated protein Cas8c/Csd1 [uncultured Aquimonas sp.]ODU41464.1 MAG: type I-C CRISPR-associated protein Cas8c/Csd1 [Xanthomonadaceae bacterium SCN 69-123]
MILQSLVELYERRMKLSDANEQPAPLGFENKEIPFLIEIDSDGRFLQLRDVRLGEGKARRARPRIVPQGEKKTSGVKANLLWDTAEYVLGCPVELKGKASKPERLREQHLAFRQRIENLPEPARSDAGVAAVLAFLDSLDLDQLARDPLWEEIRTSNPLMSFRLSSDDDLVCQRPAVEAACRSLLSASDNDGLCLVSGEPAPIERLHAAIKGVLGAQTSGANIVSFNQASFASYGKSQGANAPVGKDAAAKYTTALNDLLGRNSRQRAQVGDTSMVFWSEQDSAMEQGDFLSLLGIAQEDDPAAHTDRVAKLYAAVRTGQYAQLPEARQRFFVLGLAPNAARLSVRFWHVDTIAGMSARFARWFDDIALAHGPNQPDALSLNSLLRACALQGKLDNLPPSLGSDILRAVLTGAAYPQSWLHAALRRFRAERRGERSIDYPRVAALKACLNRMATTDKERLTVSLDPDNTDIAYRLGRLFAVLERIQEEANPRINATIRDRYFGAASSNPMTVFPTLLRLKNHHLGKLGKGRAKNLETLIGSITDALPGSNPFPAVFDLAAQGRFAVGYYHQRQDSSTYRNHQENAA